jgi:hypothetical protein
MSYWYATYTYKLRLDGFRDMTPKSLKTNFWNYSSCRELTSSSKYYWNKLCALTQTQSERSMAQLSYSACTVTGSYNEWLQEPGWSSKMD